MGLIRSIVKGALVGAAREVLARFGPVSPNPPAAPAEAPPLAAKPEPETPMPRLDPRTDLADYMEDQAHLRRTMGAPPLIDPDYDEIIRGTPKGQALLAAHGYGGSNPWQAT